VVGEPAERDQAAGEVERRLDVEQQSDAEPVAEDAGGDDAKRLARGSGETERGEDPAAFPVGGRVLQGADEPACHRDRRRADGDEQGHVYGLERGEPGQVPDEQGERAEDQAGRRGEPPG
jgi:hypothetical protein